MVLIAYVFYLFEGTIRWDHIFSLTSLLFAEVESYIKNMHKMLYSNLMNKSAIFQTI